jgi:hypothetical protein
MEAIDLLGTVGNIGHKNLVFSTVGDERAFERLGQGPVKPATGAAKLGWSTPSPSPRTLPTRPRLRSSTKFFICEANITSGRSGSSGTWRATTTSRSPTLA